MVRTILIPMAGAAREFLKCWMLLAFVAAILEHVFGVPNAVPYSAWGALPLGFAVFMIRMLRTLNYGLWEASFGSLPQYFYAQFAAADAFVISAVVAGTRGAQLPCWRICLGASIAWLMIIILMRPLNRRVLRLDAPRVLQYWEHFFGALEYYSSPREFQGVVAYDAAWTFSKWAINISRTPISFGTQIALLRAKIKNGILANRDRAAELPQNAIAGACEFFGAVRSMILAEL